jgi:hypothetical protein
MQHNLCYQLLRKIIPYVSLTKDLRSYYYLISTAVTHKPENKKSSGC